MNSIHPTALLMGDVQLGVDNVIGPNVVIYGPARIGDGNWLGAGVVIGAAPEVRGFDLPSDAVTVAGGGGVLIGDRNVFREASQVHQGWKATTTVGDDAYIMNQCYIAHDCVLGDGVTLASSVLLAGHVHVGSRANLGLGVAVHQRRHVGEGAMVGMSAVITKDLPPFTKSYGSPARVMGANVVGMERAGLEPDAIQQVAHALEGADQTDEALAGLTALPGVGATFRRWLSRHDG